VNDRGGKRRERAFLHIAERKEIEKGGGRGRCSLTPLLLKEKKKEFYSLSIPLLNEGREKGKK